MTERRDGAKRPVAIVRRLDEVEPEQVSWLVPGMIPAGKLTILEGNPGLGKSTLLADLAARVSRGWDLSGLEIYEPGFVILLSSEDGLGDTVRPRLDAAGGDSNRILVVDGYKYEDGPRYDVTIGDPHSSAAMEAVEDLIKENGALLLCIDVLVAYLSSSKDAYRDHDIRRALQPLVDIAERTGCAIVAVRHLRKDSAGSAITAGGGSIGIAGAARSVLLVDQDPDNPDHRVLAVVKSNLAARHASLKFSIEPSPIGASRVVWLGTSDHTADSLTAARGIEVKDRQPRTKTEECSDCLRDWLNDGSVSRVELFRLGKKHGFSESTVERAAHLLGVRFESHGFGKDKHSLWSLPSIPSGDPNSVNESNPETVKGMAEADGNGAQLAERERAVEREAIKHENDPERPNGE